MFGLGLKMFHARRKVRRNLQEYIAAALGFTGLFVLLAGVQPIEETFSRQKEVNNGVLIAWVCPQLWKSLSPTFSEDRSGRSTRRCHSFLCTPIGPKHSHVKNAPRAGRKSTENQRKMFD